MTHDHVIFSKSRQPLTRYYPAYACAESGPYTITLTTNNAAEDEVWTTSNSTPAGPPILVLGGSAGSSYTFDTADRCPNAYDVGWGWRTFYVSATADNTGPGCTIPPSGTMTSNLASNMQVIYQAPKDAGGNPIMTIDNPDSPAPGSSEEDSSGDPTPPPANLVEVDFIYPADYPSLADTTLTVDPSVLRFWSSDTEGSLLAGGAIREASLGLNPPTTIYAELSEGLTSGVGMDQNYDPGMAKLDFNGISMYSKPAGVGLEVQGDAPSDPDATIPLDSTPTSSFAGNAAIYMRTPACLPTGATVTLTMDSSLAQDVDVYDGYSFSPILGPAANGATSYTWTVGTDNVPGYVLADATAAAAMGASSDFLTLTVTPPAAGGAAMTMAAVSTIAAAARQLSTADEVPATGPTTSVSATQPAVLPAGGYLVAFDGSAQTQTSGTMISGFLNNYNTEPKRYVPGLPIEALDLTLQAEKAVNDEFKLIEQFYAVPANRGTPIDIIGYSRGCFEATKLAKMVSKGVPDPSHPGTKLRPLIRFVGLISPVIQMSGEDWPRTLPAGVALMYEARDNNPGSWLFPEKPVSAAPGTTSEVFNYPYDHGQIGFRSAAVQVYEDLYKYAQQAGVPVTKPKT